MRGLKNIRNIDTYDDMSITLPPNMLREIYKVANRRTQAKMHVLDTSTRANKNMPQRSRSYLNGHGKYQKLWRRLPGALMTLHYRASAINPYSITYEMLPHGTFRPKMYGQFLKCMISMYKRTRQSNNASQSVDIDDAIIDALGSSRCAPSESHAFMENMAGHAALQFREALGGKARMRLELLMDDLLVFLAGAHDSMERTLDMAIATDPHTSTPSAPRTSQVAKVKRATYAYGWGEDKGVLRDARLARRAIRRP